MDGSSGPGVGSPARVMQEGGVGMMMLGGMVGAGAEDTAGGAAQEDSKKRKTNEQTRKVFIRRMIF